MCLPSGSFITARALVFVLGVCASIGGPGLRGTKSVCNPWKAFHILSSFLRDKSHLSPFHATAVAQAGGGLEGHFRAHDSEHHSGGAGHSGVGPQVYASVPCFHLHCFSKGQSVNGPSKWGARPGLKS